MEQKNTIDINFGAVGHALARKLWLILIVAVLAAALAFVYVSFIVTPLYSSDAAMYIGDKKSEGGFDGTSITISNVLTEDYSDIITRRIVLDQVVSELGLDMNAAELKDAISVVNPTGTRMLEVTVTTNDPTLSKTVVDKLCEVSAIKIQEIVNLDYVTLVDNGLVNESPVNINKIFSMAIAAIVGILITVFIIVVRVLVDDKIRTTEDVERYLELSVLGAIPRMEQTAGGGLKAQGE